MDRHLRDHWADAAPPLLGGVEPFRRHIRSEAEYAVRLHVRPHPDASVEIAAMAVEASLLALRRGLDEGWLNSDAEITLSDIDITGSHASIDVQFSHSDPTVNDLLVALLGVLDRGAYTGGSSLLPETLIQGIELESDSTRTSTDPDLGTTILVRHPGPIDQTARDLAKALESALPSVKPVVGATGETDAYDIEAFGATFRLQARSPETDDTDRGTLFVLRNDNPNRSVRLQHTDALCQLAQEAGLTIEF